MTETELYRELGALTKHRENWEASIPYVVSLLASDSVKIRAKALYDLQAFPNGFFIMLHEVVVPAVDGADDLALVTQQPGEQQPRTDGTLHGSETDAGHLLAALLREELVDITDNPPFLLIHRRPYLLPPQ